MRGISDADGKRTNITLNMFQRMEWQGSLGSNKFKFDYHNSSLFADRVI